jgi:dihydroflavonol-4-reductase
MALLKKQHPATVVVGIDVVREVAGDRRVDGIEYKLGIDLSDAATVAKHIAGCDVVINTVGYVSFSRREAAKLFKLNGRLPLACAEACAEAKVPWLVHLSSVAALGYRPAAEGPVTEDYRYDWDEARRKRKYYMLSKHEGDRLLASTGKAVAKTIVFPGLMLGPGDRVNTPGMLRALSGRLALAPPGTTNVVDVRDAAAGVLAILEKGAKGDAFIIGGENLTYKEMFGRVRKAIGLAGAPIQAPRWWGPVLAFGGRVAEALASNPLPVTADNFDSMFAFRAHSSEKARKQLGYAPRYPVEDTFRDFIAAKPYSSAS